MRYALAEGLIAKEPTIGVQLPREQRPNVADSGRHPLTAKQIKAICQALPEPWNVYTRLAAATGMRPEEVAGLQVRDFDTDAASVRVERVWTGARYEAPKTKLSRRTIRLDLVTALELEKYLHDHERRAVRWFNALPKDSDLVHPGEELPLFCGVGEFERGHHRLGTDLDWIDYSKPVKHGWFYMRHWQAALKEAGLPEHWRFYDLRHAHASMIAANIGKPGALTLKECQERLGHSNMSTFYDRYVHSAKDENNRQRDALDALWADPEDEKVTRLKRKA